jgi:hypothetical protein
VDVSTYSVVLPVSPVSLTIDLYSFRCSCYIGTNSVLGIWVIRIVEEIKLLMLPSDRLLMTSRLTTVGQTYPRKNIRDNARYLVTWNIKQFSVGYFPMKIMKFFFIHNLIQQSEFTFYNLML